MKPSTKKILINVGIIVFFLVLACIYFSPLLEGKALPQGDLQKYEGMAKAQKDFHAQTGDYSNWASNMFSGMPGYQITNSPQHSVFNVLRDVFTLHWLGWHNDIGVLFLYLVGFFVALLALGLSSWMALLGALAFGFGSYNIIIIEAGHITKAWCMAMMAPILAGMMMCFKGAGIWGTDRPKAVGRLVWGGILFAISLGVQIAFNHIQITFYTAIGGVVMGVVYLVYSIKDKYLPKFFVSAGVLLAGVLLALACNTRHLLVNEEYMHYTMRGGKEITVTPADLHPEAANAAQTQTSKGLDINYAFSWSYGVGETYTLLVPGAMGGGSGERVGQDSEFYKNFRQERAPLYWGNQPFTSGPVYFGAIVIFLFILGLFIVKGPERWWILVATIIAILMSWGRNFMGFNEWLFNNLPLYNKFRTPSMSLVLANVTMVLLAVLALKQLVAQRQQSDAAALKRLNRNIFISAGITLGILVVGLVVSASLSFSGASDAQMAAQYGNNWGRIQEVLIADRHALFNADSLRSICFVVVAAACVWLFANNKVLKRSGIFAVVLALLVLIDLWNVDKRYLNKDNFTNKHAIEMMPSQMDQAIDQLAAQYGDEDYRVVDFSTDTYNNSTPSAYHKQIGGYSAAKLRRYQDLIDFYLGANAVFDHYYKTQSFDNYPVLDMLNARYIVLPMQNGQAQPLRRNSALGNAWCVADIKVVDDANAEILALNDFNPATTAIVAKADAEYLSGLAAQRDSAAVVKEVVNKPANLNLCKYEFASATEQLVVFSEINYPPDWFAYIDGQKVDYIHANYVLRALRVPAGNHIIEFRNESPTMHKLDTVTMICSIVSMLLIAGVLVIYYRKRNQRA